MFLQRYPIYSITCSSPWHRLAGNAETKQKRFFFFFPFTASKHKGSRVWVAVRKAGHGTLFTEHWYYEVWLLTVGVRQLLLL